MSSLDELFEGGSDDDRPMAFEIADDEPTPFDHLANLEDREHIAAALLEVDTLHREVLVLRFHEELSLEEIAKVTRAPLSTVKSRLYRGMAMMKPKLERLQRGGAVMSESGPQSGARRQAAATRLTWCSAGRKPGRTGPRRGAQDAPGGDGLSRRDAGAERPDGSAAGLWLWPQFCWWFWGWVRSSGGWPTT